ncbi:alpha-ketoacid dehydrogenase subunit beta, partial [Acinetobacter baumannii]
MDFLMMGFDPLINYAAKLRYKTGGLLTAPVVVKTTAGALGQGVAHAQCLEAWLMGVPGLRVVAASTPEDAYGLMKTALRSDGPVVYI